MNDKIENKKILNVPHLRFKEFSGEWVRYKCSDFLVNFPTNSLSWEMLSYDVNSEIFNLHYGLIHNGAPALINIDKYKLPCIKNTNIKEQTVIENGDIIFADASEDTNEIAKSVEFINTNNKIIYSGLHTIHTRDYKKLTIIGFKAFLFQSYYFHRQVERITQGTKIYSLNFNNFKEIYVSIPHKTEQQKITNFLTLIDNRIETQMKIIEEYKSLIKGIREKVFNNYKGKAIKLHEVLSEYTEKNTNNDLIPVAVGKYGIRQRSEIYTKELSKNLSKNKVVSKNTLIIGMGTKQIDIGILLDDISYCVSPAYTTFRINNIDAFYLNELLIHINPLLSNKYMITSARQGKSVNKKDLLKHTILIHHDNEQYKIVALFKHLYMILRINELLLKNFQDKKIYFLNNLFI